MLGGDGDEALIGARDAVFVALEDAPEAVALPDCARD